MEGRRRVFRVARLISVVLIAAFVAGIAAFATPDAPKPAQAFAVIITVNNVSPGYGPTSGGTYEDGPNGLIEINGTGFDEATAVSFNSQPVAFTKVNDNLIKVIPPAHETAEGVTINIAGQFGDIPTLPCLLPLPCANAFFYTSETALRHPQRELS